MYKCLKSTLEITSEHLIITSVNTGLRTGMSRSWMAPWPSNQQRQQPIPCHHSCLTLYSHNGNPTPRYPFCWLNEAHPRISSVRLDDWSRESYHWGNLMRRSYIGTLPHRFAEKNLDFIIINQNNGIVGLSLVFNHKLTSSLFLQPFSDIFCK